MTHINVQTSWKDSGYDCDHCGGRVWRRTDKETGRPSQTCLQCEACGCQWTLKGAVQRVGNGDACRRAQQEREINQPEPSPIPPAFIVVGVIGVLLVLVLVGGITAVRFLIPLSIAVLVGWALYRYGRDMTRKS